MLLPQWLLDNLNIAAIGALFTFLTILATFYKTVAIPLYNGTLLPMVKIFNSIFEGPKRIDELSDRLTKQHSALNDKLDILIKEFKPNGGSSLKDQINRLENAMSLSEAQRLLLLNNVNNGVWASDVNGNCIWANEPLIKSVQGTVDDFVGTNWENIIYPPDRQKVSDEWMRAIRQKRDFNLHYRLYKLHDNTPVEVHGIATPARNFDGKVTGWNGVIYFT